MSFPFDPGYRLVIVLAELEGQLARSLRWGRSATAFLFSAIRSRQRRY